MEKNRIKLAIADDHPAFLKGFLLYLKCIENLEIVGTANNGQELLNILETIPCDFVILDIMMPVMDGISAVNIIRNKYPELKIAVITGNHDDENFNDLLNLGVRGFLFKDIDYEEVELAIKTIISGNVYLSKSFPTNVHIIEKNNIKTFIYFTRREKEILELIFNDFLNKEIANQLNLSIRTVEGHINRLLKKTKTTNSVELKNFSISNKLIDFKKFRS